MYVHDCSLSQLGTGTTLKKWRVQASFIMPIGDEHQHYYLTWLPIMYHHYRSLLDMDTLLI